MDGKIIFGEKHSFISKGKNVDFAGNIRFSNKGRITEIENASGHYKSNFDDINIVIDTLEKEYGIDISNIKLINYNFSN